MPPQARVISICVLLSSAGQALAQDSVSTGSGLPGDALSPYAASANPALNEQSNNYVVDLADLTSSWGGKYRLGPVVKASFGATGDFTRLMAATVASNRFVAGAFALPMYDSWRAAGQGVNAIQNAAPIDDGSGNFGPRSTLGLEGAHFALAFMEFSPGPSSIFGDGDDEQSVIVALCGFEPQAASRLYVSRVAAAANKLVAGGSTGTASFGIGGVDALGSVHILADGFGMTSASAVPDKRLLRVQAGLRGTGVNQINSAGASDAAATSLLQANQIIQTTPTLIPASVAGRPLMVGMDFAGNFLFEAAPGALTPSTAWSAASDSPRGPVSITASGFARLNTSGTSAATLAALSKTTAPGARTRAINLWGATSTGAVSGTLRLDLPASGTFIDPTDAFDPANTWAPLAQHEFTNYASQVSFRGPSGPAALVVLPGGDLLVAATVAATGNASALPQSMDNYLAVARVNAATGAATWSIAAHTGDALGAAGGLSKIILGDHGADGIPGTADAGEGDGIVDRGPDAWIGRIARAAEGPNGSSNGPSISAPALDRLGNLYFIASTQYKVGGGGGGGVRFSTSLLRANYAPATGAYELERLLDLDDTFAGINSTLNYRVSFLSAADGDSVDSGSIFSSSIVQDLAPGIDPDALAYADPRSLGALVIRATIVYDRDAGGAFLDPTLPGNAGSPDQACDVALVLMPGAPTPANPVDFNGDGNVDPDDLGDFINAYFSVPPDPRADFNADGNIDPDDLGDYINAYFAL
ncbi:MAG: hypothetical protein AB7K52_10565 [Phycisphaerales bacterium]